MKLSANEIYQTSRKACLALGLTHDRAEDIAHAINCLHAFGFQGCQLLYQMLNRLEQERPNRDILDIEIKENTLYVRQFHPAFEGVAIIDWLIAADKQAVVYIEGLTHPLVFSGLICHAASRYQLGFLLADDKQDQSVLIPEKDGRVVLDCSHFADTVTLTKTGPLEQTLSWPSVHSDADKRCFSKLEELAHQTYVPETELSRLSGAGAGLLDND